MALLRAGGLQAAFGTDGKALQVGLAAATGLEAARLPRPGSTCRPDAIAAGFESAYGGTWGTPDGWPAIRDNWIKAYPCCLLTHAAIDAAEALRAGACRPADWSLRASDRPPGGAVRRPRRWAQAKFSIAYTTAHTLLHGPPSVESFAAPDAGTRGTSRPSGSTCEPT